MAINAEKENNRHNSNYVHFEQGVAYGFELALEKVAKFQFWNDARTNPPKFDKNRERNYYPLFICVTKYNNSINNIVNSCIYDFDANKWLVDDKTEVLYWQEYSILPKGVK